MSYEYNGVTIYEKDGVYYIYTQDKGKGKICFPTDVEAEEYITDCLDKHSETTIEVDEYKKFILYCKNLPGKCFFEGKLATYNIKVLNKFINSYKKENNVEIIVYNKITGGEYYYIVDEVYKL